MKDKKILWIILANVVMLTLLIVFTAVGSVDLSFQDIIRELVTGENEMVRTIVFKMRLARPRKQYQLTHNG